jgi:DNA-binding phage protein
MALKREYRETVISRIQKDKAFACALYAEAVEAILEGEGVEALSMLRDLVHGTVTFPELAAETGIPAKSLHRILSQRGNPRLDNLSVILGAIQSSMGIHPHVKLS